ncbi:hypothetical protein BGT96224_3960 [Blumeria graminis f. sp. tritici 96224]|uniref:Hpc2-related domain-containing protein n=1 Tax=Blumeria graminis f. sp. tritici 96224 TaxID=1268274 RepID=A0A656KL32_BLUGR|nr:hypothetical protein BGT96224_3960 [Blumeria graminis f. sp. tritici 96224]
MSISHTSRKLVDIGAAAQIQSPQMSSEGLSSPPRSSPEIASPPVQVVNEFSPTSILPEATTSSSTIPSNSTNPPESGPIPPEKPPPRRKLGRKPKEIVPGTDAPKPKRVRKPKDPNAPPPQRRKKNPPNTEFIPHVVDTKPPATAGKTSYIVPEPIPSTQTFHATAPIVPTQKEDVSGPIQSFFHSGAPTQPVSNQGSVTITRAQPVRTSGQNYDPIRSSNYDPVRETVNTASSNDNNSYVINSHISSNQPHHTNYASSAPSISSLVDPPLQLQTIPSTGTISFFNHQTSQPRTGDSSFAPVSPKQAKIALPQDASTINQQPSAMPTKKLDNPAPTTTTISITSASHSSKKNTTTSISATASPKSAKNKDTKDTKDSHDILYPVPPPLPGSGNDVNDGTEYRAPTVILNIPINGEVNKYVNFTRLAEQQYGWDALHPRLAAQRDRLARVAAAGAALERNGSNKDSGDEMSLDSEAEGSNAEMGGLSDTRPCPDGARKVPKKRKMREDEYDKDDEFVDDTELLWEEQAAATNDGFFVYSGPLIPEGEKPTLESRADGAPKRGRGRGNRGGTTRGTNTRGGTAASSGTTRSNLPASGPGSRGGSTARKPRITKADRIRMEQEKLEREKAGQVSTPSSLSSTVPSSALPTENIPVIPSQ